MKDEIKEILDYLKNYELIKQDFALYDDILEHNYEIDSFSMFPKKQPLKVWRFDL